MRRASSALINVLFMSGMTTIVVVVWVLSDLGGLTYYGTPLRVRGYAAAHAALRPSGTVAHPLGVVGLALIAVPLVYAARKKWRWLSGTGSMSTWLEVHIFCGIVGPVLVTFHSSFRFNGIISVAYWSMVAVVLSGFVGRYLYVRIPKSIRGIELTREEIEARVVDLAAQPRLARGLVGALAERTVLTRRLERLNRTKRMFALWHVFHQPLVYVMFAIAVLHVGLALYMGYAWW